MADVITESDWFLSPKPIMLVQAVSLMHGGRMVANLKELSRSSAFSCIKASSCIPVFVDGVNDWYDGGLRNHNPSRTIIDRYGSEITELTSIYTRPERLQDALDIDYEPCNAMDVLKRSIEIMNIEISKRDAEYELAKSREYGFKLRQIFLPIQSDGFYDISEMERMYVKSYNYVQGI